MSDPCAYGLALNGNPDNTNIKSRPAAIMFGVGKSTINSHRKGVCSCPPKTDTAAPNLTGKMDLGPDGGEFIDVQTAERVTDWAGIFERFNLDPDTFEIVDDTVRMSTWQQSRRTDNGDRDVVNLYSYRARFRRKSVEGITAAELASAQAALRNAELPTIMASAPGTGAPCAAVINLADIQGGKSEGGGVAATLQRLTDGLENVLHWLERMRQTGRNITELVIVNNGDPYEGCAGNYDSQLFTVELNHRGQMNFVLDVWTMYARELFPRFKKAQFVSVLCNHTEMGRLGGRKNQTSDSDSGGAFLAESLQRILDGRPEFNHVQFTIPHDQMNVYADISGVPVAFNHGHKIPGNDATGFEKWLNGQVRGDMRAHQARVWITAHRHNFQAFDLGSTSVFQCPSADGGSKWLRDMTGKYSRSGILAFLVGNHDPLGWSDPAFL